MFRLDLALFVGACLSLQWASAQEGLICPRDNNIAYALPNQDVYQVNCLSSYDATQQSILLYAGDIASCLQACSDLYDNGEPCLAVNFNATDQTCQGFEELYGNYSDPTLVSATLIQRSGYTTSPVCPDDTGLTYVAADGASYRIRCDQDFSPGQAIGSGQYGEFDGCLEKCESIHTSDPSTCGVIIYFLPGSAAPGSCYWKSQVSTYHGGVPGIVAAVRFDDTTSSATSVQMSSLSTSRSSSSSSNIHIVVPTLSPTWQTSTFPIRPSPSSSLIPSASTPPASIQTSSSSSSTELSSRIPTSSSTSLANHVPFVMQTPHTTSSTSPSTTTKRPVGFPPISPAAAPSVHSSPGSQTHAGNPFVFKSNLPSKSVVISTRSSSSLHHTSTLSSRSSTLHTISTNPSHRPFGSK